MGHIRLQEEALSTRLHRRDDQITHLGERGGEERERERKERRKERGKDTERIHASHSIYYCIWGHW